jgi:transposase
MLAALVAGERDPKVLAQLARRSMRGKITVLEEAFTGHFTEHHAFLLGAEKYRRIARRRGSKRAIVAIGRSILVIAWHLLSDPDARFYDLGPGYYAARIDPERRKRTHIRELEALGYTVTLKPAA